MKINARTKVITMTLEEMVDTVNDCLSSVWNNEIAKDDQIAREIAQFNDGADLLARRIRDHFGNLYDMECQTLMDNGKEW